MTTITNNANNISNRNISFNENISVNMQKRNS